MQRAEDGKRAAAAMRVEEEEEAKRAEAARKAEEEEALASECAGLFTPLASKDVWPLMPGGGTCLLDREASLCPWGVVLGAVVGTAVIGCVLCFAFSLCGWVLMRLWVGVGGTSLALELEA